MENKLYRVHIKENEHLTPSRENNNRLRGVSRDENNNITGIPELEEVKLEDYYGDGTYESESSNNGFEDVIASVGALLITYIAIEGTKLAKEKLIKPWWEKSGKKLFQEKKFQIKKLFKRDIKFADELNGNQNSKEIINKAIYGEISRDVAMVYHQIFNDRFIEMTPEEASNHFMKMIYYLIGYSYEKMILSSLYIVDKLEDENKKLEMRNALKIAYAKNISEKLNEILSKEAIILDDSSRNIYELLGGGVIRNNEYTPVDSNKILMALTEIKR